MRDLIHREVLSHTEPCRNHRNSSRTASDHQSTPRPVILSTHHHLRRHIPCSSKLLPHPVQVSSSPLMPRLPLLVQLIAATQTSRKAQPLTRRPVWQTSELLLSHFHDAQHRHKQRIQIVLSSIRQISSRNSHSQLTAITILPLTIKSALDSLNRHRRTVLRDNLAQTLAKSHSTDSLRHRRVATFSRPGALLIS